MACTSCPPTPIITNLVSSNTKQGLKQGQSTNTGSPTLQHTVVWIQWALSIQPKIPGNFGRCIKGNRPFPLYSGPALKLVLIDRPGYFGRSDRNVPFHLTKLLSPVPLFCILQPNARWLGSGICNREGLFHWARGISEISNRKIVEWKAPNIFYI